MAAELAFGVSFNVEVEQASWLYGTWPHARKCAKPGDTDGVYFLIIHFAHGN